jgi:hypothetical protein
LTADEDTENNGTLTITSSDAKLTTKNMKTSSRSETNVINGGSLEVTQQLENRGQLNVSTKYLS